MLGSCLGRLAPADCLAVANDTDSFWQTGICDTQGILVLVDEDFMVRGIKPHAFVFLSDLAFISNAELDGLVGQNVKISGRYQVLDGFVAIVEIDRLEATK